jgi:hypothetical protein
VDIPVSDPSHSSPAPAGGVEAELAHPRELLARLSQYLRQRPILCLFLLTPGLVEYLSGSSSFVFLVVSPGWFFLALAINAAMYTSGALLIREAVIRWNKGWPTVFALGGAYSIMEEGISDQTIFNPHTSPIGPAGLYGHFLGVNWLWLPEIFVIHILMSLFLPILLLGYALPETRGKSLLSMRQIKFVTAILAVDVAFLALLVVRSTGNWYGFPLLVASIVAILGLSLLGWKLPRTLAIVRPGPPSASRFRFFVVGGVAYPLMVVATLIGVAERVPPLALLAILIGMIVGVFLWVVRNVGTEKNERHVVAFGAGLLVLGMILGVLFEFPLELVAIADAAVVYFFFWLDRDLSKRSAHAAPEARRGILGAAA